jgi:hypothetical protein
MVAFVCGAPVHQRPATRRIFGVGVAPGGMAGGKGWVGIVGAVPPTSTAKRRRTARLRMTRPPGRNSSASYRRWRGLHASFSSATWASACWRASKQIRAKCRGKIGSRRRAPAGVAPAAITRNDGVGGSSPPVGFKSSNLPGPVAGAYAARRRRHGPWRRPRGFRAAANFQGRRACDGPWLKSHRALHPCPTVGTECGRRTRTAAGAGLALSASHGNVLRAVRRGQRRFPRMGEWEAPRFMACLRK